MDLNNEQKVFRSEKALLALISYPGLKYTYL